MAKSLYIEIGNKEKAPIGPAYKAQLYQPIGERLLLDLIDPFRETPYRHQGEAATLVDLAEHPNQLQPEELN